MFNTARPPGRYGGENTIREDDVLQAINFLLGNCETPAARKMVVKPAFLVMKHLNVPASVEEKVFTALWNQNGDELFKEALEGAHRLYLDSSPFAPSLETVKRDLEAFLGQDVTSAFLTKLGYSEGKEGEPESLLSQLSQVEQEEAELIDFSPLFFPNVTLISIRDILQKAKEPEWVIPGLIPQRGVVLLAGKGGVGKSFLTLELARSIATGTAFLNLLEVQKPGSVLIFDRENDASIVKERAALLKMSGQEDVYYVAGDQFYFDVQRTNEFNEGPFPSDVWTLFAEKEPRLVIFDSWTQFIASIDENNAVDVNSVIRELRRAAYSFNTCFLIIHHLRKAPAFTTEKIDELRGSSALVNAVDVVLLLRGSGSLKTLQTVKNRLGPSLNITFDWKIKEDGVHISGFLGPQEEELSETERQEEEIVNIIADHGGEMSTADLIRITGLSKTYFYELLADLVRKGKVERPGRGIVKLRQTQLDTS